MASEHHTPEEQRRLDRESFHQPTYPDHHTPAEKARLDRDSFGKVAGPDEFLRDQRSGVRRTR